MSTLRETLDEATQDAESHLSALRKDGYRHDPDNHRMRKDFTKNPNYEPGDLMESTVAIEVVTISESKILT